MCNLFILSTFAFATLIFCLAIITPCIQYTICSAYAQDVNPHVAEHLKHRFTMENVFTGINGTTNMAFIGPNDILALEADSGKVRRIVNGQMLKEPLLDVNSFVPDGLIGIATAATTINTTSTQQNGLRYVFLYFDEAPLKYNADVETSEEADKLNHTLGYVREGDRLYRYELVNNKLVDPKLLFEIPDKTKNILGEMHHGGEVLIGPDNYVYLVIGDIDGHKNDDTRTKAQNYKNGTDPDGRAGILRITQDGKPVGGAKGILGDKNPLNLYYAYGIRSSFGMDFDPVTGNLWDTENGPDYGDEINLVYPGFNSGFDVVDGMPNDHNDNKKEFNPFTDLVDFNGKGKYSDPEFVWNKPVGPTAIKFLNSDKYGKEYQNDMFVGDINNGNIYHFDLNNNRTHFLLNGELKDKVADNSKELKDIIFAQGFNGIVDLQVGPDGYLYILSDGSIFRIRPLNN